MKKLALLVASLGLLVAAPAAAEDCFVHSSVMMVSDGAIHVNPPQPTIFMIVLNNGQIWQVATDNVWIARTGAGGGVSEGDSIKICRKWGSLHMTSRNTGDGFVVFKSNARMER